MMVKGSGGSCFMNWIKYIYIILVLLILPRQVFAVDKNVSIELLQDNEKGLKEYSQMIKDEVAKIKHIEPSAYFKEIDKYRTLIEKFIENKKMVCNGEFSTLVLSDSKITPFGDKRKLSKQERDLCLREISLIQAQFINNSFIAKRNFLDYLHRQRVNELIEAKEKMLSGLKINVR